MRLGKFIRDKLRPQIGVPISDDRKISLNHEIGLWDRCNDHEAKLYLVLKAICVRVGEEADRDRKKPFYPAVQLPCTPREEIDWIRFRDTVENSYLRVLVDREVGEMNDIGIDAYIEKHFGSVEGVQQKFEVSVSVPDSRGSLASNR